MCNMCNTCGVINRGCCGCHCGYNYACNNSCAWGRSSICRDCCGNIWVRVANNSTCNTCNYCGYACNSTTTTSNGNASMTQFASNCINGDAYYAQQYGLTRNNRSSGCGCGYSN